jgi:hypothetical protein
MPKTNLSGCGSAVLGCTVVRGLPGDRLQTNLQQCHHKVCLSSASCRLKSRNRQSRPQYEWKQKEVSDCHCTHGQQVRFEPDNNRLNAMHATPQGRKPKRNSHFPAKPKFPASRLKIGTTSQTLEIIWCIWGLHSNLAATGDTASSKLTIA